VLALSGGGYRGLYTVKVLARLEEFTGQPITEQFDLITGTSIGGIIALALAAGIRPKELVEIFLKKGDQIFPGPKWNPARILSKTKGFFRPIYKKDGLERMLHDMFGELKMKDLSHAYAMVPCTSLLDGKPKFFKTPHSGDLYMDREVPVIDAALATSAAPVYFPAHYIKETSGIYVDGGLVGNAPGIFGYIEAVTRLGAQSRDDVVLLSIGTLGGRPCVSAKIAKKPWWKLWGVPYGPRLGFWLNPINPRLLQIVFSQNEQQAHNMLNLLLKENYHIIDDTVSAEGESDIALDDPRRSAQTLLLNRANQQAQEFTGTDFFKTHILAQEK
jgi:predicted acylesterase/phospholipase RssA